MRIASGSALFVACLVVASSANGRSENASATHPPQRGDQRVASLGTRKERGLYGDLSIDSAAENVEVRKVTPILDRLPAGHEESKGSEPSSDRSREPLAHESTGNLPIPLQDQWTASASPSRHPNTTQTPVRFDQLAFPSDLCLLEPSAHMHVHPPLYSGPPNTPLIGSGASFLTRPLLSRTLAHCSTSLSIWCSENQKPANLDFPHVAHTKSSHPDSILFEAPFTGKAVVSPSINQDGTFESGDDDGNGSFVGTHIADGGWVSNLVQTLSS